MSRLALWGPPTLLSSGYQGFSPKDKAVGHEADHSPPNSAEVKNMWSYTSTVYLHGVVLG